MERIGLEEDTSPAVWMAILSIFVGFWSSFLFWLVYRGKDDYVASQAKQMMNFQITMFLLGVASLYMIIHARLFLLHSFIAFLLSFVGIHEKEYLHGEALMYSLLAIGLAIQACVWVFYILVPILAAINIHKKRDFRYPLALKILR